MKNEETGKVGNIRQYASIQGRIQGKDALIRGNIMGKNVNFSGRTVASPGDANGAIFSNGTFFGMNNNATEDISTIAVTTTFNWFQIIMDLEQGKTFGKVNGTLISTDGQTITDDQFPAKFGFGVEGGGSNRILFNQVHIYYAWSFPLNPNDF